MRNICVIPARMGSSRFPNKPMAKILGFPMIGHVALRCKLEPIFDEVFVATCDFEIVDFCSEIGIPSILTSNTHERASDRVNEAVIHIEREFRTSLETITMVQGDEPMVTPKMLLTALDAIQQAEVVCVNLRSPILDPNEYASKNCVKVVVDHLEDALYFSREPIPSNSKYQGAFQAYKQVCVIPFKRSFLDTYSKLAPSQLEIIESIDMNRCLEHGFKVRCVLSDDLSYPVDVPADILRVEEELKNCRFLKRYYNR